MELIQPTTMFARLKGHKTTFHWSKPDQQTSNSPATVNGGKINLPGGITVDASCNTTITVSCLKQLYNAVGFVPSGTNGNQIGITGYLEEFANIADLQQFYADQVPEAVNTSFNFLSVNGICMYFLDDKIHLTADYQAVRILRIFQTQDRKQILTSNLHSVSRSRHLVLFGLPLACHLSFQTLVHPLIQTNHIPQPVLSLSFVILSA